MLISLTVGKVDAGVAVLLTPDKRLIEFPSILLPPHISSGSIVDITVSRNLTAEIAANASFSALQHTIFTTFGVHSPSSPIIRCRNATQTSVVLEWDPISLATANLRSLSLYRNGSRAGSIPRPHETRSTKISGLAVDTEYSFHLVLRTSAGTYTSEKLAVRTHKMTDLSGITVTPGVLAPPLRESLEKAIERVGAKMSEGVRIDTTHFVCTEGRGQQWERAVEMNIPVVRPEWLEGCEREGRIVGVRGYYLNADPRLRMVGPGVGLQQGGQPQQTQAQAQAQAQPQQPPQRQEDREPPQDTRGERRPSQTSTKAIPSRAKTSDGKEKVADEEDGVLESTELDESETPPPPPPKDEPEPKALSVDEKKRRDNSEAEAGEQKISSPPGEVDLRGGKSDETTIEEAEPHGKSPGGSFSEVAL